MIATDKQIIVGAYQKSFNYFTDGFWALCEVHENFHSMFDCARIPKSPKKWGAGWLEIEIEAQTQVFGSMVIMPYYSNPDSPHHPPLPKFGLNTVEYQDNAIHFKIERKKTADPKMHNPWVFTVFPGNWGDNALIVFKKQFENAGWEKAS